jgi:hypothetical protein
LRSNKTEELPKPGWEYIAAFYSQSRLSVI